MKFFKKKEPVVKPEPIVKTEVVVKPTPPKKVCNLCKLVSTQGRSGEIAGVFLDGDPYTAEIINQTKVEGKECYTLFIQNDSVVGFNEMPISYCPKCGAKLGRKK